MLTKQTKLFLLLVLVLATLLRSYKINSLPQLNPDEAALGYNAYSLLQTGKDEHGQPWPIHFKSFGDYKPGGYVYLSLPFIKFLGLTPLSVRLPNLILSIASIYLVFLLARELSQNHLVALYTSLALTLSPWHIHFSRGAWESATAFFFILLGIYLFHLYLKRPKFSLILFSALAFVASLYIYHSARIISPLIVFYLFISHFNQLKQHLRQLLLTALIASLFTLPVLFSFLHSGGAARFGGVGLTADKGPLARSEELLNQHSSLTPFSRVIHNRRVLYLLSWSEKYFSHFDLNFLFLSGDEVPRSRSPDMGQLHLIDAIFILLGVVSLLKSRSQSSTLRLILALLLISPLASSLTFQAPSALRSLPLVLPFSLLIGYGLAYFHQQTSRFFPHQLFLLTLVYIFSLFYFIDAYFVHAPQRYPFAWNTGFSEMMPYLSRQSQNYSHVYFTNTYDQPYILYLFFNHYPPQKIQSQIHLTPPDNFGFSTVADIDNIHFGKINWDDIPQDSLVISGNEIVPANPKANIIFPGGSIGFKIYEK